MPPRRPRKKYDRRKYRSRPLDPRFADEPTIFECQLGNEAAPDDTDPYRSLRWACLRRALLDLENAWDVAQGLRHPLEDQSDYDGSIAEVEEFFFSDEHAKFHPNTTAQTAAPAKDSPLESVPAVSGFWTVEPSDGIFSFA